MYIERCKHGLGRGWSKPTAERQQGDSFLLYFAEPRSDGGSNAKIANILEYGRSGQPPKPFLKPAKSKARKQIMQAMTDALEREMNDV